MSNIRYVQLTDKLGKIDPDFLPAEDGCAFLCLTYQELHILRKMVFPYARWRTRFVRYVQGELYRTTPDAEYLAYLELLDTLELKLGGCYMDCKQVFEFMAEQFADSVGDLADAVRETKCQVVQICGPGGPPSIPNYDSLIRSLTLFDPADFEDPEPLVEPPAEDPPPEGFETWEEYRAHKCRAAYWLMDRLIQMCSTLEGLAGAQAIMANVAPAVMAYGIATGALAFTPVGFVLACVAILSIMGISIFAMSFVAQIRQYLEARHEEIVCALYQSGTAADAQAILADLVEDAIEAIIWSGALAPFVGVLNPALGTVFSQVYNTSMVNILFRLVEELQFPEADCTGCDELVGILLRTSLTHPYDLLVKGDSIDPGTDSADNGFLIDYPTQRMFYFTPADNVASVDIDFEFYHHQTGWSVLDCKVVRVSPYAEICDFDVPLSNGGWRQVADSAVAPLVGGVQYAVRMIPMGGNKPWVRKINLES